MPWRTTFPNATRQAKEASPEEDDMEPDDSQWRDHEKLRGHEKLSLIYQHRFLKSMAVRMPFMINNDKRQLDTHFREGMLTIIGWKVTPHSRFYFTSGVEDVSNVFHCGESRKYLHDNRLSGGRTEGSKLDLSYTRKKDNLKNLLSMVLTWLN